MTSVLPDVEAGRRTAFSVGNVENDMVLARGTVWSCLPSFRGLCMNYARQIALQTRSELMRSAGENWTDSQPSLTWTFWPVRKGVSISSDNAPRDGSPDKILTTSLGCHEARLIGQDPELRPLRPRLTTHLSRPIFPIPPDCQVILFLLHLLTQTDPSFGRTRF
jgi:hypothetical protein